MIAMVFAPAPGIAAQLGYVDYGADPDSCDQDGMSLLAAASAEAAVCIQVAKGIAASGAGRRVRPQIA